MIAAENKKSEAAKIINYNHKKTEVYKYVLPRNPKRTNPEKKRAINKKWKHMKVVDWRGRNVFELIIQHLAETLLDVVGAGFGTGLLRADVDERKVSPRRHQRQPQRRPRRCHRQLPRRRRVRPQHGAQFSWEADKEGVGDKLIWIMTPNTLPTDKGVTETPIGVFSPNLVHFIVCWVSTGCSPISFTYLRLTGWAGDASIFCVSVSTRIPTPRPRLVLHCGGKFPLSPSLAEIKYLTGPRRRFLLIIFSFLLWYLYYYLGLG